MRYLALIAALSIASASYAQESNGEGETIIKTHGIGTFDELKLPADFKHLPYVNPDAPKGGEISQSIPNSTGFDNFNPFTYRGRGAVLSNIMLETILTGTADEVGAAYCLLCENIEYPESRDWVIFNLRPNITFSDGTKMTADDVLFSYETLSTKGLSSLRVVLKQLIAKAEVLDEDSIKFTFTPDYPRRDVIQAAGGLPVFSKKDFEENERDLEQPMQKAFLGSGPYVFENARMNRNVSYKRNPDYWGQDIPINKGRFNFDRIRFEYFADYDAAFEAFKSGEYTFRREVSATTWANRYNFPAIKKGWVVQETLPDGSIGSAQAWVLNLRRPDWQDIRVRKAIGLMFNFEWANKAIFYGLYERVNSFWDNSELAATGKPSKEELALLEPVAKDLPDDILTEEAVMQPASGERQLDRRNLREAAALLDEAGWMVGDDGMRRNAEGRVLKLEFLNDSQTFDRVINPFVQNLRALGIDARNVRVDNAEYENRKSSHNFDIISTHLGQDPIPGAGLQQFFGSANVGDVFNSMGLANPAIDALIKQVENADSAETLKTSVNALDRALRSISFWVPQWRNSSHLIAYYDMFEHPENLPPYSLGELDFWWYNQEKAEKLREAGALR